MKPLFLAYSGSRGLDMMTPEDAQYLTHINLAFGVIRDGLLSMEHLPRLREQRAHILAFAPHIRFVLSVGGWGAGGFSLMSRTEEGRSAFAQSVRKALDEYSLDGVDIDWEYPCSDSAGIDADPSDRVNFTLLLQALRDAVGEGRIVSIAAGGGNYFIRDTEMEKVAKICDYVQIMTYDLRSGFCGQAGHHTSLFAGKGDTSALNTDACVHMFEAAGVPRSRIITGAAFYSRRWDGVPDINHGLLQKAGTLGNYGPAYHDLVAKYIDKDGFTRYWDDEAKAPYLFNGSSLISYDDPESLRCKCAYVKAMNLGGIMFWEYPCDETHTLVKVMGEALK